MAASVCDCITSVAVQFLYVVNFHPNLDVIGKLSDQNHFLFRKSFMLALGRQVNISIM